MIFSTKADSPRFAGWSIVAAAFVVMMSCSGLGVYALSVYLHSFVAQERFALEQVSIASSMFSVSGGLISAWVGKLLDRHDIRRVITSGCVLMAAALLSLPWVSSLPLLYAFYIVLGMGYAGAAVLPCTTLVARWFHTKRAAAMSLASTGNSFGAVVLVPPAALLIDRYGLNTAAPCLAAALLILVLPLTWRVMRSWPSEMGLRALGESPAGTSQAAAYSPAVYAAAKRSRHFLGLCMAFALGMAAHVGGQTHLFNRIMVEGLGAEFAAMAVAVMAASSIVARLVYVRLIARWGNAHVLALLLVVQGAALIGIGPVAHPAWLLLCVALYGSTLGSFITQQSLLISEAFDLGVFGRLLGLARVLSVPGVLLGPGLMGWLFHQSGNYAWPYAAVGVVSIAGVIALRWATSSPVPRNAD